MKRRDCCLCSQIEGREESDLIARLLPGERYARRIMLESAGFAVIPSLGPLVPGHSLLCPKDHIKSFAQIDDGLHGEYEDIKARLTRTLREMYAAEITVFEHGMDETGDRILCTVDHAHVHLLPLPPALDPIIVSAIETWTPFDGSLATLRRLSAGREYIFCETPDGDRRLLRADTGSLAPQYMRRIIAEGLGRAAEWNWRQAPDPRAADEIWRRFVAEGDRA